MVCAACPKVVYVGTSSASSPARGLVPRLLRATNNTRHIRGFTDYRLTQYRVRFAYGSRDSSRLNSRFRENFFAHAPTPHRHLRGLFYSVAPHTPLLGSPHSSAYSCTRVHGGRCDPAQRGRRGVARRVAVCALILSGYDRSTILHFARDSRRIRRRIVIGPNWAMMNAHPPPPGFKCRTIHTVPLPARIIRAPVSPSACFFATAGAAARRRSDETKSPERLDLTGCVAAARAAAVCAVHGKC